MALAAAAGLQAAQADEIETVVVTGFKESLERALDLKRNALDSSDSILAEDIAKFPDLNVSESLQRIPGVALARDAGEGREIAVRGLGAQFTRVRINGLEALATTGSADSSGGTNRGRSFDFNVFASELFSNLTVHKSATAEIEEGSLGATVDLHTAHPFDFNKFTFVSSFQGGYNDLAGSFNPRGAVLVSDTFLGGRVGVLFSAAYAVRHIIEDGTSTVRWQNDGTPRASDGSAPGVVGCVSPCSTSNRFKAYQPGFAGPLITSGADYNLLNEAFRPRFARYDLYHDGEKRLGITGSVQWQPDDDTLFTFDALFADFAAERDETYLESPVFSTSGGSGIGNVVVGSFHVNPTTNTLDQLTANNIDLRVEHRLDHLDTRFAQFTLDGTHNFSDKFKVHGLVGWAQSNHRNPIQTTLTYDLADVQGYSFDYSGTHSNVPVLDYGSANVTTPGTTAGVDNWYLSQIRIRPQTALNIYRSAEFDGEYDAWNWLTVRGGFDYKEYGFKTTEMRLSDGTTASKETFQTAPGVFASGAAAFYGAAFGTAAQNLSNFSTIAHLPSQGLNIASPTPTAWLEPALGTAQNVLNYYGLPLGIGPALGNNKGVSEHDTSGWLQFGWDSLFYGVPFRGNLGVRYVSTDQTSTAYNLSGSSYVLTHSKNSYDDFLPSLNAVVSPSDDFLVRLNLAQVMARPDLGQLSGTSVSVSGNNRTVTVGNPSLKPFRANTADLSFEWYYHKGALLSIAVFYKKIGTYIQSYSATQAGTAAFTPPFGGVPVTIDPAVFTAACGGAVGCTAASNWSFSESINTPGGSLDGIELNWQQPFDFLPDPFSNLGFLGNVTYVDSSIVNGTGTSAPRTTLTGQSHLSYNATGYYDDGVFQARLSAAFRSKYLTSNPGRNGNDIEGNNSTFNLDASASYRWDDNFTLTFEALNLTNQFQDQYVDSVGDRLSVYHQTGREFFFGIRYNY
ncbi:MAG: TonB-dependent receptor [Proteobacteria bacterium]|nr:TonB-dependent receptor [Pseudomonadota bacterium]